MYRVEPPKCRAFYEDLEVDVNGLKLMILPTTEYVST